MQDIMIIRRILERRTAVMVNDGLDMGLDLIKPRGKGIVGAMD